MNPIDHPKLSYSVEELAALSSIGRTKLFESIKEGKLKARKVGQRTIILADDAAAFLASLPSREAA